MYQNYVVVSAAQQRIPMGPPWMVLFGLSILLLCSFHSSTFLLAYRPALYYSSYLNRYNSRLNHYHFSRQVFCLLGTVLQDAPHLPGFVDIWKDFLLLIHSVCFVGFLPGCPSLRAARIH